jgi:hypothetical protein
MVLHFPIPLQDASAEEKSAESHSNDCIYAPWSRLYSAITASGRPILCFENILWKTQV